MKRIQLPPRPPEPLTLRVLKVAIQDLEKEAAASVVDRFNAVVEQMQCDQEFLESLRIDFYGERPGERWSHTVGVRKVKAFAGQDPPKEIWRFKIWELENVGLRFRFFYAYFERTRTIVILATSCRDDTTYDFSNELIERISVDYERLLIRFG